MKLIIFGAGREGYKWYYLLRGTYEIQYFVDNTVPPENDKLYSGFGIYSPQKLLTKDADAVILISSFKFCLAMTEQLKKWGFVYERDFLLPWDLHCADSINANLLCTIGGGLPSIKRLLDGRKLALIFGNCHTKFIREAIQSFESFNSRYLLLEIPMIWESSAIEVVSSLINNGVFGLCKLFITQYVDENNKFSNQLSTEYMTSKLASDCQVVRISNMWSTIYYPQAYDIPKEKRVLRVPNDTYNCLFRFGDKNIDELCKSSITDKQIIDTVSDNDYYSEQFITERADREISDFSLKEIYTKIDVKMGDYIRENYRKNLLFYSFMHPTPIAIEELTNRILRHINIDEKVVFDFEPIMYNNIYSIPVYPSVIRNIGLEPKYNAMMYYPNSSIMEKYNFSQHIKAYIMYRRGMMKYEE